MHLKYISSTRIFSSRFTKIFLLFCACAFIGSSIGKIVSHNTARQTAASAQSSNWGLSFQEEGKRPVGNATIDELAQYNAFCWRYRRKENLSHLWRRLWKWKYSCYFGCTEKHQAPATFLWLEISFRKTKIWSNEWKRKGILSAIILWRTRICQKFPQKNLFRKNYPM